MEACPLQFRTIYFCGPWYHESETETFYHKIHRYFTVSVHLYFYICVVIQLYFLRNNVDEFSSLMYSVLDLTAFTVNMMNFIFRRKQMIELQKWCEKKPFRPRNDSEKEILKSYNLKCGRIFRALYGLYCSTIFITILTPLMSSNHMLPFNSFVFYKMDTPLKFWITYVVQSYMLVAVTMISACLDSMAVSFMILATGQFELLTHRIANCKPSEHSNFIKHWSIHYTLIRQFTNLINDVFITMVIANFSCSLFVLASCIYVLSQV